MNYYAQYSLSKKGWYVYQETELGGTYIYEGPYTRTKAHERANELNESNKS